MTRTQLLTHCLGVGEVEDGVVVEGHVKGVAVVPMLHPLRDAFRLGAAVGHWGFLRFCSYRLSQNTITKQHPTTTNKNNEMVMNQV